MIECLLRLALVRNMLFLFFRDSNQPHAYTQALADLALVWWLDETKKYHANDVPSGRAGEPLSPTTGPRG